MKTTDDLFNDIWDSLKAAKQHLDDKGYKTHMFTSLEGRDCLAVEVEDEDGEQREFVAHFEEV